ncbi:GDSL esterase/lipase [Sesamum alatum]|uniref:GDSL esterase/lipase n=1 Tax=Sesamum alatum TaxID=300844 RepID=A0AAE1YRT0_9LAMI|nr:GDSL esterase/lipase [Sesamum alatum]
MVSTVIVKMRVFAFFLIVLVNLQPSALSAPQVPCFFIFGDSLVDGGNNNDLATLAKVNYLPYGIDFPQGPTGRFTNAGTSADFLAELLGFDAYIPPFAKAQGNEIIKGVNYASGSAGIRDESGEQLGPRISMHEQLLHHNVTVSRIARLLGNNTSPKDHLRKCLYYFVVGSNDYLNNYFRPEYYNTSKRYSTEEYAAILTRQFSQQLKTLYGYGARKVAVTGVGPVGCTPSEAAKGANGSLCVDSINDAVVLFNDKLKALVKNLNTRLTDAKFVYIPAVELTGNIPDPGVKFLFTPCCEVSNSTGLCLRGKTPCTHRELHLFFDNFHPTATVYEAAATAAYVQIRTLTN